MVNQYKKDNLDYSISRNQLYIYKYAIPISTLFENTYFCNNIEKFYVIFGFKYIKNILFDIFVRAYVTVQLPRKIKILKKKINIKLCNHVKIQNSYLIQYFFKVLLNLAKFSFVAIKLKRSNNKKEKV